MANYYDREEDRYRERGRYGRGDGGRYRGQRYGGAYERDRGWDVGRGDPSRYGGLGCRKAVANIAGPIAEDLAGRPFERLRPLPSNPERPAVFAYGPLRGSALGGAARQVSFLSTGSIATLFDADAEKPSDPVTVAMSSREPLPWLGWPIVIVLLNVTEPLSLTESDVQLTEPCVLVPAT